MVLIKDKCASNMLFAVIQWFYQTKTEHAGGWFFDKIGFDIVSKFVLTACFYGKRDVIIDLEE